jgi:hypothetical protein
MINITIIIRTGLEDKWGTTMGVFNRRCRETGEGTWG